MQADFAAAIIRLISCDFVPNAIFAFRVSEKKKIILWYISNIFTQSFQRNCVDIMVIQINHAWLGVVKPKQKIDQSGFSVAGAPDDGKGCPGWDVQIDIMQYRRSISKVRKGQVIKRISPLQYLSCDRSSIFYICLCFQDFLYTADGCSSLGKHDGSFGTGEHRPYQHIDILIESYEASERNLSDQGKVPP